MNDQIIWIIECWLRFSLVDPHLLPALLCMFVSSSNIGSQTSECFLQHNIQDHVFATILVESQKFNRTWPWISWYLQSRALAMDSSGSQESGLPGLIWLLSLGNCLKFSKTAFCTLSCFRELTPGKSGGLSHFEYQAGLEILVLISQTDIDMHRHIKNIWKTHLPRCSWILNLSLSKPSLSDQGMSYSGPSRWWHNTHAQVEGWS